MDIFGRHRAAPFFPPVQRHITPAASLGDLEHQGIEREPVRYEARIEICRLWPLQSPPASENCHSHKD